MRLQKFVAALSSLGLTQAAGLYAASDQITFIRTREPPYGKRLAVRDSYGDMGEPVDVVPSNDELFVPVTKYHHFVLEPQLRWNTSTGRGEIFAVEPPGSGASHGFRLSGRKSGNLSYKDAKSRAYTFYICMDSDGAQVVRLLRSDTTPDMEFSCKEVDITVST